MDVQTSSGTRTIRRVRKMGTRGVDKLLDVLLDDGTWLARYSSRIGLVRRLVQASTRVRGHEEEH